LEGGRGLRCISGAASRSHALVTIHAGRPWQQDRCASAPATRSARSRNLRTAGRRSFLRRAPPSGGATWSMARPAAVAPSVTRIRRRQARPHTWGWLSAFVHTAAPASAGAASRSGLTQLRDAACCSGNRFVTRPPTVPPGGGPHRAQSFPRAGSPIMARVRHVSEGRCGHDLRDCGNAALASAGAVPRQPSGRGKSTCGPVVQNCLCRVASAAQQSDRRPSDAE
jgi:hypothetical protein